VRCLYGDEFRGVLDIFLGGESGIVGDRPPIVPFVQTGVKKLKKLLQILSCNGLIISLGDFKRSFKCPNENKVSG
jgi:hypothetical protein